MASRRQQINRDAANPFGDSGRQDMSVQDADELLFGNMDPTVLIAALRLDGGTQPRASLDEDTIQEYTEAMIRGDRFPPVVVFYDGQDHWLADGFHRVMAAQRAGLDKVRADIKQGTRRDAVLHSVGVNAQHGLRRSNADKRRAVETLLSDAEWAVWSDREIAKRCKVSNPFVSALRKQSEIQPGRSLLTVNSENESSQDSGDQSPTNRQPKQRTYITKHGTTATMNVGGIRAAGQARKTIEPEPVEQGRGETTVDRMLAAMGEHGDLTRAQLRAISNLSPEALDLTLNSMLHQGLMDRVQNEATGMIYFRLPEGAVIENPNAVGILDGDDQPVDTAALRRIVLRGFKVAAEALDELGETSDAEETRRYADSLRAEWRLEA